MTALTFLRARRRKRICVGSGGGRFTLTRSESDKRGAEGGVAFSTEGVIFREMCKTNTAWQKVYPLRWRGAPVLWWGIIGEVRFRWKT